MEPDGQKSSCRFKVTRIANHILAVRLSDVYLFRNTDLQNLFFVKYGTENSDVCFEQVISKSYERIFANYFTCCCEKFTERIPTFPKYNLETLKKYAPSKRNIRANQSQPTFTYWKLTIETLEKGVKYVKS